MSVEELEPVYVSNHLRSFEPDMFITSQIQPQFSHFLPVFKVNPVYGVMRNAMNDKNRSTSSVERLSTPPGFYFELQLNTQNFGRFINLIQALCQHCLE